MVRGKIGFFVIVLLLISACSPVKEMDAKKVLVLGIDGMDPQITKKLLDEDKLPNFKKLIDEGSFNELPTTMPPHSPVAWTSMSTGSNPGKHNIFDFIRRDPDSYMPELSLTKAVTGIRGTTYKSLVKATPFWKITSEAGIKTSVIRWPVTFPPEEVYGELLSGLGVPNIKGLLSGYTFYTSEEFEDTEENKHSIKVEYDDIIDTSVKGPRKRKGGELVDVEVPMEIKLDKEGKKASLRIQGKEYVVNEEGWSDWIHIKFKAGFLQDVYGITMAYVQSIEPFNMYMSDVEIDPENPLYPISHPKSYSGELAKKIGTYHTLGLAEDTGALNDDKISDEVFLQQTSQIEEEREKMFWEAFEGFKKSEKGVLAFVFDSGDRIQHMFWNITVLNESNEPIHSAVEEYYVNKDKFLGKVLEEIGDISIMIVSDHGISSFERAVSINTWLVENGYMILKEEITEDDDGALFKHVDWSKTKAYSVGFNSIFVNTKGRESHGIVEAKQAVKDEIIEKLSKLTDPENEKKVVFKVYDAEEEYIGESANEGPDLTVGFYPGYRMSWQNAIGGFTTEVFTDNTKHWMGDHLIDPSFVPGIVVTNFEIKSEKPHQMDVAPTVLRLLGLDVPEDMDGKSLI